MNIKQAKQSIKDTVRIYLKKNEFGEYVIPIMKQRPVFLVGAPGVGKTMIMEQIAAELNIALVSYSMTHHTRQSALGLPYIREEEYDGVKTEITEYTMSEIIASVYQMMEETGMKEGILFLDEINCVSETLSPSMLQFLQYKVFGRHRVPEGWVIVTAGNPPEFNKSVREFDVAQLDRLKVMEVVPDYAIFKEYAADAGIHPAIIGFLDINPQYFYLIENTVKGRSFVTARGWEDLSEILKLYEEESISVDEALIGQYLRNEKVVREYAVYYELYNKYKRIYATDEILKGNWDENILKRAGRAELDERLSLLMLLTDGIVSNMKNVLEQIDCLMGLAPVIKSLDETDLQVQIADILENMRRRLKSLRHASSLSREDERRTLRTLAFWDDVNKKVIGQDCGLAEIKARYNDEVAAAKDATSAIKESMHFLFEFVNAAFGCENEMLILVTTLTTNKYAAAFIARFSSEDYTMYADKMMSIERRIDMSDEIKSVLDEIN